MQHYIRNFATRELWLDCSVDGNTLTSTEILDWRIQTSSTFAGVAMIMGTQS
jgi:hypothetical protein